ncbi:leucine-rich repeat-containing protein 20 [Condylostylus longicornis]|uniref:leucine-rich repeat-containing protein 20 n=1 Tax=Condylostylus longicornis TaxID=2530218 RepID=UPI00244E0599|nr:leucine-rich repeat-containing protein 20 [Condylostylus longicornis]
MAHEVVEVVRRCEEAKETFILDLSKCKLTQVPDAVYHLMKNTPLIKCDLSGNVIKIISAKFSMKFNLLAEINLSRNEIARLPDELESLESLSILNISHNSFITFPTVVFKVPKLKTLIANDNAIVEVDTDEIDINKTLEFIDLRNNPFSRGCLKRLKNCADGHRMVLVSEHKEDDDW